MPDTDPALAGGAGSDLGSRMRRYREERGLSLSQLSEKADVSKGYLSTLENTPDARPSAETLYAIATALGVTISDLMGRRVQPTQTDKIPPGLLEFAKDEDLPESDIRMLAAIKFRGDPPQSKERWRYIYTAIRISADMDR